MEGSLPVRRLSREELYTLVWKTPISRLARDFGIFDRGLSKTCVLVEQAPLSDWEVCDACECGLPCRPIRKPAQRWPSMR